MTPKAFEARRAGEKLAGGVSPRKDRRQAGLTQAELAHRAAIRPETLNRIEKGKTTPDTATIAKIERALEAAQTAEGE